MEFKHTNFHKDFRLNGYSFPTISKFLSHTFTDSNDIHCFLKEWYSEKEYMTVRTSGSTGVPKEIQFTKKQFQNSAFSTGTFFDLKAKTTALSCLPIDYIAGKMMLIRAITLGWHLDMIPGSMNPLEECVQRYDFSAMVPLQLENSLSKLHKIRKLIVGGGAVSKTLQKKLQTISTEVFATYGMTETITHIAVRKLNNYSEHISNNKEYDAANISVSLQENEQIAQFYTALPNTSIYKDERNCLVIKNSKISDHIIFTNDIVELISDRQFEWLGRFDNVINSGGIKLHPEKIEEKLAEIMEYRFFVTGIANEILGEKLILILECSAIVLSKIKDSLYSKIKHLKTISRFEVPKEIYGIEQFKETGAKKIQRKKTLDLIDFSE